MGLKDSKIVISTLISFLIPLFVLILAQFILKERFKQKLWLVTLLSLTGVAFTLNFNKLILNTHIVCLLISAFLFALLDVLNKKYISKESMLCMVFYSSFFVVIYTAPFACKNWLSLSYSHLILSLILGFFSNMVLFFLLKSFSFAKVSFLAPFRYVELIISSLGGWLFFGELPSYILLFACVFIVPSALYVTLNYKE
jgi:S-adenosylmethionine uptake transporter